MENSSRYFRSIVKGYFDEFPVDVPPPVNGRYKDDLIAYVLEEMAGIVSYKVHIYLQSKLNSITASVAPNGGDHKNPWYGRIFHRWTFCRA
jgi:hypothetical protein